jgi:hypothetical protein
MPAHGSRRLLIILRIELFAQGRRSLSQYRWRDADVDQFACGLGQYGPVGDGKECRAKVSEQTALHSRLRRQACNGIITVPPGEFVKEIRGFFLRNWHFDGNQ